jgi:hypothetical protein
VASLQSEGRTFIVNEDGTLKNISVCGINISLCVIEFQKKKGSYAAAFKKDKGKMLGLVLY